MDFERLPGGELIEEGLEDLGRGLESIPALLVAVGAPRLRQLGLEIPEWMGDDLPEHRLYLRLARDHGNGAHSRYNSLILRLVSFERALACVS